MQLMESLDGNGIAYNKLMTVHERELFGRSEYLLSEMQGACCNLFDDTILRNPSLISVFTLEETSSPHIFSHSCWSLMMHEKVAPNVYFLPEASLPGVCLLSLFWAGDPLVLQKIYLSFDCVEIITGLVRTCRDWSLLSNMHCGKHKTISLVQVNVLERRV